MKTFLLILVLLFPLHSEAQFSNWTPTDKALLAASTTMLILDWGQTLYIAKNPVRFHELNPILGEHPSVGSVNTYFAAAIIGNYLLADWLGATNRRLYLGGITALEAGVVLHNRGLGIKVSF